MRFRVTSLNLEQDHKRWDQRRPLIESEIARLKPDILALNEVCVPRQTARSLWRGMGEAFHLVQQTRVNGLADVEGEALITRFPWSKRPTSTTAPATWWPWLPGCSPTDRRSTSTSRIS